MSSAPATVLESLAVLRAFLREASSDEAAVLYNVLLELWSAALVTMVPRTAASVTLAKTDTQEPDEAFTARQCARESGWRPGGNTEDATGRMHAGFSPRWFYDHADELSFRIGGRGTKPVRFSRRGLRAWLRAGG